MCSLTLQISTPDLGCCCCCIAHLPLLSHRISHVSLRYRERLEYMLAAMHQPHTKLQEILVLQSQQSRPNDVYSDTMADEDIEAMCRILKQQRDGLQHLTDILTKDTRDVLLVKKHLQIGQNNPAF